MNRYACWPEGRESAHQTIEANDVEEAACCYVEEWLDEASTIVVADETAKRWLIGVSERREFFSYRKVLLGGADLFASDPMPTPEAERLRDEMAGGAK